MKKINAWQDALIDLVTEPDELLSQLGLGPEYLAAAKAAATLFPLKVPRSFIARMEKGNPRDPLLQQILPLEAEFLDVEGFKKDPLEETRFNPVPGLLHKYYGRVLLTLAGSCGINCRYCFRRHFNYEANNPGTLGWEKALDYIRRDSTISEVLLSGGDPLLASDQTLKQLTIKLTEISHVKRLRIHSRMPIVLPSRITPEFIAAVTHPSLKTIMVVHCNHPNEIDQEVKTAIALLAQQGFILLNQTVLLKGINDHVDTLVALSESLFAMGIQPYYLHRLDKVQGTAHFDIDNDQAKQLHWEMTQRLSGYLVPKLVFEQAGAPAKLPLDSPSLSET